MSFAGTRVMLISQCRIKRVCLFLGAILLGGTSLFLSWAQYYRSCSNEKHQRFLEQMCSMYHNHTIVGNMCSKVCDEDDNFRYDHCGNNKKGKNVIILKCKNCDPLKPNINVVLKSEHDMDEWEDYADLDFARNKSFQEIVSTVRSRILHRTKAALHLDLSKQSDLMSFMWNEKFHTFIQNARFENAGQIAALNILGLGLQLEYTSLKYFEHEQYMPKLYGTCGPAYFVEYTPSFGQLGFVLFQGKIPELLHLRQHFPSWSERSEVAVKLLQFLRIIDRKFHSTLNLCDIKPHNFGINDNKEIALLDTDSFKFGMDAHACNSDIDCRFLGCESTCNVTSGTCLPTIKNNNLQRICDRVFLSGVTRFGLLRSPPQTIANDLTNALQECAYPSKFGKKDMLNQNSHKMLNKLESILLSTQPYD